MLSSFRSKFAKRAAAGVFAIVVVAFVITGVGTGAIGTGRTSLGEGDTIATVGNEKIGAGEAEQRARRALADATQQQPGVDMAAFVAGGGLDQTLDQLVASEAMAVFGRDNGIVASRKMIDGDIAGIAAFNGPTGKFDQSTFRAALAAQHISEDAIRTELAGDIVRRQLLLPIAGAARVPTAIATAYAALLLEKREGEVAIIPAAATMAGGANPGDAEIAAFYKEHLAAFTTPERRMLRFALMGRDQVAAGSVPSEAEIARAYAANAASYAPRETRTLEQVVLGSEAKAQALAASVRGGKSFADAAKAAGFAASDIALGTKSQAEVAGLSSPAVAAAAFAAREHGISAPARSDFGWHVLHVVGIVKVAGKSLAEARPEIAATLVKQKQDAALAALVNGVEDRVSAGASFADIVRERGLAVVTTPAVAADGTVPGDPAKPAAELLPLLKDGFAAGPDDPPTVETIAPGERYALLGVAQVIPAAAIPLAQVRERVVAALAADRAATRSRAIAEAIAAKVAGGASLDAALAAAGVKLPAPQKVSAERIQLAQRGAQVPAPIRALFLTTVGKPKLVAIPGGAGWFVVALERVTPGDAAGTPKLIDATRAQLARAAGEEYVEAFARAAQSTVGVKRDDAAIANLRAQLLGAAPAAQQ